MRDTSDVIHLTPAECTEILANGRIAHIACESNGEPYVTPMSFVRIGEEFYFRTGEGRRVDALRSNPRVCIEVTILREGDAWQSVVFWGNATFVDEPNERADVVAALLQKYHSETALGMSTPAPLAGQLPIVAITPEDITGRASGGGFTAKTRPGRL